MNVIEEFAKLSKDLEEKMEQVKELRENAAELRDKADQIDAEAKAIDAEIKTAEKYSKLFKEFMDQQNALFESEDATFRSYTKEVCEFVADDEGFSRATASYRRARQLPGCGDEETANKEAPPLPLAEVG